MMETPQYSSTNIGPALSVVAPMHNEEGVAYSLVEEIASALNDIDHEIIIVDDCSTDGTSAALKKARADFPQLRIIRHENKAGQSRALRTAILAARGKAIATLDGDGQNDPADIPALYNILMAANSSGRVSMVAGERQARQDSAAKKWASAAANGVRKRMLKDGANDTGCGLKVFYRDAFLMLPYFDHLHRYLPALMRREGYEVLYAPVSHRPRAYGSSKYTNLGRLMVAFRDLIGVTWLLARAKSPGEITEED